MSDTVMLLGCGDVGPIHEPVGRYSELVRGTLAGADIRFAQVERVYSERGALQPNSGGQHSRLSPAMASVFTDCGFNVVSVASNHAMDWGAEALLDTIELLHGMGIQTIGGGRKPCRGTSTRDHRNQGAADRAAGLLLSPARRLCRHLRQAGVAPLRAHTRYEPVDYQPGMPPRVVTIPAEEDLAQLIADMRAASKAADHVVLSLHWGVHFVPRVIADYQKIVTAAALAAGADLILGHHAHVPKAIEVRDGKTCFYSLSNFIMSSPAKNEESAAEFCKNYGVSLDPDYPHLPYGTDAKRSLIAKAVFSAGAPARTAFLPVMIDPELRPEILRTGDPRFTDMLQYMEWASEGFAHRFAIEGDEIAIAG